MNLFTPLTLGSVSLRNRIVMAPMTRSRADTKGVPSSLTTEYYGARADAGLIITEGTGTSEMGMGYARTPGIYNDEQVAAWKLVTDAVHAKGGKIFIQLMHVGRIAHSANRNIAEAPIAPSAIQAHGMMWTDSEGMQANALPRALELEEIPAVIAEFGKATARALRAGFDGVELHAASGYLPNQFMSPGANHRTDIYGGSIENRNRFVIEALQAMIAAAGSPGKIGIKVSPGMKFNGLDDQDCIPAYEALAQAISPLGLAYLHVMRTGIGAEGALRKAFSGKLIVGGGYLKEEAEKTLVEGAADAIVFGTPFIANPDLVTRLDVNAPLQQADPATFYTPGPQGYIDYPVL